MKLCFAGADGNTKYTDLLVRAGATNKLESFYSLGKNAPESRMKFYLLDSGGFVARTRGVAISVEKYSLFINKYKVKYAFNLDTGSVSETLQNQDYLIAHCTACQIIPVYHMSDWMERNNLLDKFITDGFSYIALGGTAGVGGSNQLRPQFFSHCFSKTKSVVKLHGLGVTAQNQLERFPFYSVDSTSWLSSARYGNSISKDGLTTKMRSKKYHYLDNTLREIKLWLEVQKYVTRLWQDRGIVWKD